MTLAFFFLFIFSFSYTRHCVAGYFIFKIFRAKRLFCFENVSKFVEQTKRNMNRRAKKGGEKGMNGEFYKGGTFLPSTQLTKQSPVKKQAAKPVKPLQPWQVENLKRAIDGTKKHLETNRATWEAEGNQTAINAHEAQIEAYEKKLSIHQQ